MIGSTFQWKAVAFCAALAGAAALFAERAEGGPQVSTGDRFRAAGKTASMTVAQTVTAGKPVAKVGEVVALMLERSGMSNLETSSVAFTPPKDADLDAAAAAFAAFVKANPPTTDYVLFTEFQGAPAKGVRQIRAIVATKHGEIVWKDRQAPGDVDFDRIKPREPIQCCLLVVERLRPVLGLGREGSAEGGKISERWRRESGVPDKTELAAIESRGKAFKESAARAILAVYPVHAEGTFSAESASNIAVAVAKGKLANANAVADGPRIESHADMNEQKVLWTMARGLSEYVKKNPPEADYVLYADYIMSNSGVGAVHFSICNRQGELVVVDYQNNHAPDFKRINPSTRGDCDRLLVKRLEGYSR
jgi:hypothetical protein